MGELASGWPKSGQACEFCGRTIRAGSEKAIFLFLSTQKRHRKTGEAWRCGRGACTVGYNVGEDLKAEQLEEIAERADAVAAARLDEALTKEED
jgi:hypothetical protein